MAKPRSRDSGRFRIYTSDRSGFEFGFQPITDRPNPYTREAGKPVKDINVSVSPNEFDQPPPSNLPLGGQGDVNQGNIRANSNFDTSSNAFVVPPESKNVVNYIAPGTIDSNTVLMLHMDGANGSTIFTDSEFTPKVVTTNSGVTISTTQSKFGGASGLFIASSGSFLSVPTSSDFNFGTGDFTVDFWVNFKTFTGDQMFVCQKDDNNNFIQFNIAFTNSTSGSLFMATDKGGVNTVDIFGTTVLISTGSWNHIAFVRSNTAGLMFFNGALASLPGSPDFGTKTMPSCTHNFLIGAFNTPGFPFGDWVDGFIDEYRVSKGIARWTSNFTPPAVPYSSVTATIPLTNNYPPLSMVNQPIINEPILISGSLNTVIIGATPQISLGAQSQQITLECVGSAVTLINGSGLTLNTSNSTQFVMNSGSIINFMYQTSNNTWFETSRSILYSDSGRL